MQPLRRINWAFTATSQPDKKGGSRDISLILTWNGKDVIYEEVMVVTLHGVFYYLNLNG